MSTYRQLIRTNYNTLRDILSFHNIPSTGNKFSDASNIVRNQLESLYDEANQLFQTPVTTTRTKVDRETRQNIHDLMSIGQQQINKNKSKIKKLQREILKSKNTKSYTKKVDIQRKLIEETRKLNKTNKRYESKGRSDKYLADARKVLTRDTISTIKRAVDAIKLKDDFARGDYSGIANPEKLNLTGIAAKVYERKAKQHLLNQILKLPLNSSFLAIIRQRDGSDKKVKINEKTIEKIIDHLKFDTEWNDLDTGDDDLSGGGGGSASDEWYQSKGGRGSSGGSFGIAGLGGSAQRSGSMFKYVHSFKNKIISDYLAKLQIYSHSNLPKTDVVPCFFHSLKIAGIPKEIINQMTLFLTGDRLTHKQIHVKCQYVNISVEILNLIRDPTSNKYKPKHILRQENKKQYKYFGADPKEAKHKIVLALFKQHYFIYETTPTEVLEEFEKLLEFKLQKNTSNLKLIYKLFNLEQFNDLTLKDIVGLTWVNFDRKNLEFPLEYNQQLCTKLVAPNNKKRKDTKSIINKEFNEIWFADFEADATCTEYPFHVPYAASITNLRDSKRSYHFVHKGPVPDFSKQLTEEEMKRTCAYQMLEVVAHNDIIYFHNAGYDIRMMSWLGLRSSIEKGNKIYQAKFVIDSMKIERKIVKTVKKDIKLKSGGTKKMSVESTSTVTTSKKVIIKDFYCMVSSPLRSFPNMFGLGKMSKEIFPYHYYVMSRYLNKWGNINDCINTSNWSKNDINSFKTNLKNLKVINPENPDEFDMIAYCKFYCDRDVEVLKKGAQVFNRGTEKELGLSCFDYLTISSLADAYLSKNCYYKVKDLYEVSGHPLAFMRKAIVGGRCMTANNLRYLIEKQLSDFDAKSLYPSAMNRLYTVSGKPIVIPEHELNFEFLDKYYNSERPGCIGAYIVEIEVLNVRKRRDFPLLIEEVDVDKEFMIKDRKKTLKSTAYRASNDFKGKMILSNIRLEDLIKYQDIEFKIIRGYKWNGERSPLIAQVIRKAFDARVALGKNPLQNVYKLILNSCYGKTIQKPISSEIKFFKDEKNANNYWKDNYHKIVHDVSMYGCSTRKMKIRKSPDRAGCKILIGVQVLDMSKRIMNEVMCTAEDLGISIYYQDTDSIHIPIKDLARLCEEYKKTFDRDLIGNDMGQFHSDFNADIDENLNPFNLEKDEEYLYADKSWLCDKKLYCDRLITNKGRKGYMIRGKGITKESIISKAKELGGIEEVYQQLYEGEQIEFDLCDGRAMFDHNKDGSIKTLSTFRRNIKCIQKRYQE